MSRGQDQPVNLSNRVSFLECRDTGTRLALETADALVSIMLKKKRVFVVPS